MQQVAYDPAMDLTVVQRLTRDLRDASITLSDREARYLVDFFYMMQKDRIRANHQVRMMAEQEEPHAVISWLAEQARVIESQIVRALDAYSAAHPVGNWARSQKGVGPIIASGLFAHIDINKAPTVGHIWRFAGLDPTSKWLGNQGAKDLVKQVLGDVRGPVSSDGIVALAAAMHVRPDWFDRMLEGEAPTVSNLIPVMAKRPWNPQLKVLCWKLGECFKFVANREDAYYGRVYAQRKLLEQSRNEAGLFADQAKRSLEEKNYGATTEARKHYEEGRLPPARIHLRAQRYAVKLFLAHLHEVWHKALDRVPPRPYAIDVLQHVHQLPPPPALVP